MSRGWIKLIEILGAGSSNHGGRRHAEPKNQRRRSYFHDGVVRQVTWICPQKSKLRRRSFKNIRLKVAFHCELAVAMTISGLVCNGHMTSSMNKASSDPRLEPFLLKKAARVGLLGAFIGVLITLIRQLAVAFGGGMPTLGFFQRVVGMLITVSLFGAAAFLAALFSLFLLRLGSRPRGGSIVVAFVTMVTMCGVVFHSIAIGLRLLTGSGLTHGGLAFFLNEAGAITIAATRQYRVYLGGVLLSALVIGCLIAYALRRILLKDLSHMGRAPAVGCTLMSGLSLLTLAIPFPDSYKRNMELISPELVVFGVARKVAITTAESQKPMNALTKQALSSMSRWMEKGWQVNAQKLEQKPNIIYVMLESVAWRHLGFWGYPRNTTPNLDKIAAQSLVMNRAYSTATHSNYAQMAVISSLFPRRGTTLDMYHRIDYPRVLLHDMMHSLGYATATISSQDETWQGMKRFQDTGTPTFYRHSPDHQGEHLNIITEEIVPDHETVRYAIDWIKSHQNEPFSLYMNLQSTHFPYRIPDSAERPFLPDEPKGTFNFVRWEEQDREAIINRYDNALFYVDQQVGALESALSKMGLLDKTILVFAADHGELFFEHDLVTHGRSLFDSEARVPLIFRYPRMLSPARLDMPASTLDVLPTILDVMGLSPHPAFQGESLLRLAQGHARKTGVFMNIQGWKHLEALVCAPYKLVFDPGTEEVALFDLGADPGELVDIADQDAERTMRLLSVLKAQVDAQERYHENSAEGRLFREQRFAPRMLECPAL